MVCSAADTCGHMRDRRAPGGQLVKDARVRDHTGPTARPPCCRKHSLPSHVYTPNVCVFTCTRQGDSGLPHHAPVGGSVWEGPSSRFIPGDRESGATRAQTTSRPPLDKGDVVVVVYVHYEQTSVSILIWFEPAGLRSTQNDDVRSYYGLRGLQPASSFLSGQQLY